jgi:hypothetical protein
VQFSLTPHKTGSRDVIFRSVCTARIRDVLGPVSQLTDSPLQGASPQDCHYVFI